MTDVSDELRDEELKRVHEATEEHTRPYDFEAISSHAEEFFYNAVLEALCMACEHNHFGRRICLQKGCESKQRLEGRLFQFFEMGR